MTFATRVAFAAAHVVAGDEPGRIDWGATLRFRHYLWDLGFGVADAMDTAQRGSGLSWPQAAELIRRSGTEARSVGAPLACGAGSDQLAPGADLAQVLAAYEEQLAVVEAAGAQPVLLASRALAAAARGPEDYCDLYGRLVRLASRPVILHWLGEAFDPALRGYWGSTDPDAAATTVAGFIGEHARFIDGIKVSLLDAEREIALRAALPAGVRVYTGDDFNYPELIKGDSLGHSDALLGIFDAIARPAAQALRALDDGQLETYDALMAPTVPLARHLFEAPTYHYKTGIVFLAYLNGFQPAFRLLGGAERDRSAAHLRKAFSLAVPAGAIADPEAAEERMAKALGEDPGEERAR